MSEDAEQDQEHPHGARVHAVEQSNDQGESRERDLIRVDASHPRQVHRAPDASLTSEERAHFGLGGRAGESDDVRVSQYEGRNPDSAGVERTHRLEEASAPLRVLAHLDAFDA